MKNEVKHLEEVLHDEQEADDDEEERKNLLKLIDNFVIYFQHSFW